MTLRSRLFPSDEELGTKKRDDDLPRNGTSDKPWGIKRPPWMRRWRMLGLGAICLTIFLVVYNLAMNGSKDYDVPQPRGGRAKGGSSLIDMAWPKQYDPNTPQEAPNAPPRGAVPPSIAAKAKHTEQGEPPASMDFEGPVRFFYLAASLHGIARTQGHKQGNRNVLFAASDLKAAAEVIPLACEMARWKLNFVHFAFMGRTDLPLDEIRRINNAKDKSTCDVYFHDARPDYSTYSSDKRMETSVAGALGHIDNFAHPQAVITASSDIEDDFFPRAIATKSKELGQTHIELPADELENLSWVTRLEAKSLKNWHAATIDILIQAPQETSGSLLRLMKSLSRAQYGGFDPPRLTIELPHKVHKETMDFINEYVWPPYNYRRHQTTNQLSLRRRIPDTRMNEDESSMRFIETFYPTHPHDSHVLVLSPQVELSPAYFHYLKYHLLEWRYGEMRSDELMGIALEVPSAYLNGSESFDPPRVLQELKPEEDASITSFLWQAPNSNAVLYFADKWIEFHSFLTGVTLSKRHPRTRETRSTEKHLSKKFPAWTEQMLELMRTRGYFLAFPSPKADATQGITPAIVHNELFQTPEEWVQPKPAPNEKPPPKDVKADEILEIPGDYLATHHVAGVDDALNVERDLLKSLQHILSPAPSSAGNRDPNTLPDPIASLNELAVLDWAGSESKIEELINQSDDYAVGFRRNTGGCDEKRANPEAITIGQAADLFCLEDDEDVPAIATEDKKIAAPKGDTENVPAEPVRAVGSDARKGTPDQHPKDHVEHAAAGPAAAAKEPMGKVAAGIPLDAPPAAKANAVPKGAPVAAPAGAPAGAVEKPVGAVKAGVPLEAPPVVKANGAPAAAQAPKDPIAGTPQQKSKWNLPPDVKGDIPDIHEGPAQTVEAVTDPEKYKETAIAGMKAKTGAAASTPDDGLTDLQRSELDDWKQKQRKEQGEIEDEPKPQVAANRKPVAPAAADKAAPVDKGTVAGKNIDDEDFLNPQAGARKADPDDKRPKAEKPAKDRVSMSDKAAGAMAAAVAEKATKDDKPGAAGGGAVKVPTKGRIPGFDEGGVDARVADEAGMARGGARAQAGDI